MSYAEGFGRGMVVDGHVLEMRSTKQHWFRIALIGVGNATLVKQRKRLERIRLGVALKVEGL
jgi:hypothetical protein